VLRGCRGVRDDSDVSDVETVLEQLAKMALDAQVGGHAGQDHLVDAALAQLQHQVVLLRPVQLVRAADKSLAVLHFR